MLVKIKKEYKEIFFQTRLIENEGQSLDISENELDYRFDKIGESKTNKKPIPDQVLNDDLAKRFEDDPESLTKDELEEYGDSIGYQVDKRKKESTIIENIIDFRAE